MNRSITSTHLPEQVSIQSTAAKYRQFQEWYDRATATEIEDARRWAEFHAIPKTKFDAGAQSAVERISERQQIRRPA